MGESTQSPDGRALYRAYRSHDFDEVVGQDHVVKTLKRAIKAGRIAHAYLFTGPRGVGKTSVARILAHAINEQPYSGEDWQLDIVEIDGASNRGIDEIRELRDKVHIAPTSYRYKVYIIDEVHMLTTPAFNALLKTLEEPPEHAVFILATTEAHKIPETISSRTQRYSFRLIGTTKAVKHLKDIAQQEKIKADDPALELIAKHARGSLRDAIGFLDQLRSNEGSVTVDGVVQLLGLAPVDQLGALEDAINQKDVALVLSKLKELQDAGASPSQIAGQIIDRERDKLQNNQIADIELMSELLQVSTAREPDLMLEVILSRRALPSVQPQAFTASIQKPSLKTSPVIAKPKTAPVKSETSKPVSKTSDAEKPNSNQASPSSESGLASVKWGEVLEQIKQNNNSLYAVLRLAKINETDRHLGLTFGFEFHKARAEEARNKQLLESVLSQVVGRPITVQISTDKSLQAQPAAQADSLMSVIGVMGGGSVVEYEDG